MSELAEQLVKVTDAFFDPIDLETMSKQALHDRQKALYNDVHASVCSVLDMFKLIWFNDISTALFMCKKQKGYRTISFQLGD